MISLPTPTSSEYINIGRPLTPIAQNDSWVERLQEETLVRDATPRTPPAPVTNQVLNDDNYMETTPSPKASPVFQWLSKGLRPSVSMSTIPEEDSQHSSSVARQVFPEENPSATVPESEAKAAEDIPAASADEEKEEDREVIPLASETVVQEEEDVIVPAPPILEAMDVEANEAATTITTEANDDVMAEDTVEPEVNAAHEDNV